MILTAEDIYKRYTINGKSIEVLKGVSLEVRRGEILVIQGPSGAGKSTLLHILGFLDEPTGGVVRIDGKKVPAKRAWRLRARYIGFVFQFYNLLGDFNIFENVCLPWMVANSRFILNREVKKRAYEILDLVGLTHRLRHRPNELSGGEQQRAAIARALINEPKLLLADEPTGNLDSKNTENIWDLLVKLRRQQGQTIVVVTHNEELAKRGDRVLHLIDGRIVEKS